MSDFPMFNGIYMQDTVDGWDKFGSSGLIAFAVITTLESFT